MYIKMNRESQTGRMYLGSISLHEDMHPENIRNSYSSGAIRTHG